MSVKKKDSPLAAKSADRSPVAARDAAYRVLMMVEEQNAYANLALKKLFSQIKISAADKRLATHIVYGSVRQRFSLDYIINHLLNDPHAPLMTQARVILRLSIYQLYYLDRIEPYSVVDEAVKLAKRYANLPISRLVNAVLRNYLRRCEALGGKEKMLPDKSDIFGYLHITLSYPRWLVERWLSEFGAEAAVRLALWGNSNPGLWLRTNTLKLRREELQAALERSGINCSSGGYSYETLRVDGDGGALLRSPAFSGGGCIVQGVASQLVAHALSPESGSRVLDMCAAPGGKTTHLAALMNNKGELHAFDIHEHKIKLIEENARNLGIDIIKAACCDATSLPGSYHNWADYVLLDAPCSGLGVLNVRPDSRYHKKSRDVADMAALSAALLDAAADYVRPGGLLCYSTCTITHEENGDNIRRFLSEHENFAPEPMQKLAVMLHREEDKQDALAGRIQLLPHIHGTEGFFIALLRKKHE